MWQTGTSSEYKDLLDQLVQIATSSHVDTSAVSAGGTGYTVGDKLTSVGGTFTHAATFIVTAESAGVVTGLRTFDGGAYTVNPSSPVSTTGGTGSGCTVTVTFAATGWTLKRQTEEAVSAAIGAGGTGYTVGDDLTIIGGLGVGTATVFNVDSEAAGVVTAVSLVTAGDYEDTPSNPAATTGGTGTGCTLTVTYQAASQAGVEKVAILEGSGAGSDAILVTFRTYNILAQNGIDTSRNWGVLGMTSFNSLLRWYEQPGISPGFDGNDGTVDTTGGSYMPLKDTDAFPMSFWFSITPNRIVAAIKVEDAVVTHYVQLYAGFMNPYGTSTEQPYPILVAGSTARHNTFFSDTEPRITGLTEMVGITNFVGPAFYRKTDDTWQEIRSSRATDTGSPSRVAEDDYVCYPCGQVNLNAFAANDKLAGGSGVEWDDIIPTTGIPGSENFRLKATPDTGGDQRLLVPATICASEGSFLDVVGELDSVFWLSGDGLSNEDTVTNAAGDIHRVFQNGNRSAVFSFLAITEE